MIDSMSWTDLGQEDDSTVGLSMVISTSSSILIPVPLYSGATFKLSSLMYKPRMEFRLNEITVRVRIEDSIVKKVTFANYLNYKRVVY